MTGEVSDSRVNIYDYKSSCYVVGNLPSLYHYGTANYIQLTIQGNQFNGYDYHTSSYYQGHVSSNAVTLYDYEDGKYHNYSV